MKASKLILQLIKLETALGYDPDVVVFGAYGSEGDIDTVVLNEDNYDDNLRDDDGLRKKITGIALCSDISSG